MTKPHWARPHPRPVSFTKKRRDSALGDVVEILSEKRQFRHLTEEAIRSYLLYLAENENEYDHIVRVDVGGMIRRGHTNYLTSRPPFYQYRTVATARITCESCGHTAYRDTRRRVWIGPETATRVGRAAFARGLAFDFHNVTAQVAWRLGISCIVCGTFMGTRVPQKEWIEDTIIGRAGTAFVPICTDCAKNERRDIAKWQRDHGYASKPTEDWLLLMAVERIAKSAATRKSA